MVATEHPAGNHRDLWAICMPMGLGLPAGCALHAIADVPSFPDQVVLPTKITRTQAVDVSCCGQCGDNHLAARVARILRPRAASQEVVVKRTVLV